MNKIGDILKRLREENGLTGKAAVEKLKALGIEISAKTLYGYESGRNSTNADMFLALCQIYKCQNIMEVFSDSVDDVLFTSKEWKIIEDYRFITEHSPESAKTIDAILAREHEVAKLISNQKERIEKLESEKIAPTRLWAYYGKIACAGTGFVFDDIPTALIEAPPEDADFVIGVSGDSMEPDYHDGEKLYVRKVERIRYGEVGIFTVRNECFLKEYGESGLVSRNPKYADIPGDEDVRLVGKVVGKVEE